MDTYDEAHVGSAPFARPEAALLSWGLLGPINRYFRGRAVQSVKPRRRGSKVERHVVVHLELPLTDARCREILSKLGELRPLEGTAPPHTIEAITPQTLRSNGSVLRVHLERTRRGTTVAIAAWPGAALFDWGESRRLVDAVADQLRP
jgi:hypothetical protein